MLVRVDVLCRATLETGVLAAMSLDMRLPMTRRILKKTEECLMSNAIPPSELRI